MKKAGRPELGLTYVQVGFTDADLERLDAVAGNGRRGRFIREIVLAKLSVPVETEAERVIAQTEWREVPAALVMPSAFAAAPVKTVQRLKINIPSEDGAEPVEVSRDERLERAYGHPVFGGQHRLLLDAIGQRPGQGVRVLMGMTGLPELAVQRGLDRLCDMGVIRFERGSAVLA